MSQFLSSSHNGSGEYTSEVNFEEASKLPAGGSTCDIYKYRWQRRTVFVKRLKEEYRSKPLYLDALDKEFEIGVSLNHPSLPTYLAFKRDYIIMDFIDGISLEEMIRQRDPWLSNKKNIEQLLEKLIETVDYLHRHNVVHCDIKPDNIMITSNGYNPILVDFDKCYTDSYNDTPGHPARYGLPEILRGRILMDFRGIGNIAKELQKVNPDLKSGRVKKFIEYSYKEGINSQTLTDILNEKESSSSGLLIWVPVGLIFFSVLLLGGILLYNNSDSEESKRPTESIESETIPVQNVNEIEKDMSSMPSVIDETVVETRSQIDSQPFNFKSPEELIADAQKKGAIMDNLIKPYFDKLNKGLDRLIKLKEASSMTGEELLDSIRKFSDIEDEYKQEAFRILDETFSGLSDREAWRIMSYSKVFTGYNRRAESEKKKLGEEVEKRLAP